MRNIVGHRTVKFTSKPPLVSCASIAGNSEKSGPYGSYFDQTFEDGLWGEKTYESAERKMLIRVSEDALKKANLLPENISYMIGGDLLNQIISSGFAARALGIPFIGVYGACSTMAESIMLGAMLADGGFACNVLCTTSSHYATAERQFRSPLELGTPKTPTAQNTVTGAGAVIISASNEGDFPVITHATAGRVIDMGVNDVNNLGAAMAPAAAETIISHLQDTDRKADYYDCIITGDLGTFGSDMLLNTMYGHGYDISSNHRDCGSLIYGGDKSMGCGGSGCGCGAVMMCGYFINEIKNGKINRILYVATGALHSPTSMLQKETIPSIAHAVAIVNRSVI